MKKLERWYRSSYAGENVVTNLVHQNSMWNISNQWVSNAVVNNQISNKACVIGNGISRKDFLLPAVINHFGGLLGRNKLQTYGCNALYRDHTPDFLVVSGDSSGIVAEVANSGYCTNNVVYAAASHVQAYPGKFYLIPQDPAWNAGSVAAYLAAFDGHTTVYLLGFDGQDTKTHNYNIYAGTPHYQGATNAKAAPDFLDITMKIIFDTYPNVDFVRVMPQSSFSIPEAWKYCTNLRQLSFREFILDADL